MPEMEPLHTDSTVNHGRNAQEALAVLRANPETKDLVTVYCKIIDLAERAKEIGGQAWLVGGSVRDELLDVPIKDFDVEVHGIDIEQLKRLVSDNFFAGQKVPDMVGQVHGVFTCRVNGTGVEISMPRKDTKTGPKHNHNRADIDQDMGIATAAQRRDFTINAIYKDILTGAIQDPWHGIADLNQRLLRAVDTDQFGDDALRPLRAVQLVGRFDLSVEPQTMELMKQTVPAMEHLPKERYEEEWAKLFLRSSRPSRGLELARDIGFFRHFFPTIDQLKNTPQDLNHHPEGDVWTHTMMTVDEAKGLVDRSDLAADDKLAVMLAAFLHDLGKVTATESVDGNLQSNGHEEAGVEPARDFLVRQGIKPAVIARVLPLIAEHMRPLQLYYARDKVHAGTFRRLANRVQPANITMLALVAQADHLGRGLFPQPDGSRKKLSPDPAPEWLVEQAKLTGIDRARPEPIIMGRDLASLGWAPGPIFGRTLAACEKLAEHDHTREQLLELISSAASPLAAVEKLESLLEQ